MNERKLKQLNILVIITALAALVCALLFVFSFAPDNNNRIDNIELTDYSDNWVLKNYRGGIDKIVHLPEDIEAEADEIILIMKRVPEDVNANSVLVIETEFQNIMATINETTVYSNGILNNQKLMKNAVPCYNVIDIGSAKPGDIISIYISSGYKKYNGNISSIYYGTKGDVVAELVKENGIGFVASIVLFVLTLLLLVSLVFMKNVNVDKRKSAYAFGFILAAVAWCITDNPIMQLVTGNNFGVYMTNMVLLLLMPVLYIMYQRCFAVKRRFARIFEIGIYVFAINFLTGVIFQFFSVVDFATYIVITKVLIVVALILLSGIMYLAADTFKDKTIYNNFWANFILTLSVVIEALLSVFGFYIPYDGIVLQVGIFIFLCLLVVTVEKNIIKEMNQEKETAINSIEKQKEKTVKNINTGLIYNSMNTVINSLKGVDKENSRLVYDTSIYMRYNMKTLTENGMVPFEEELEYIKAYLGMQRRNNQMLEVLIEDKVVDFMVPFNTVEPLVENAILNGALKAVSGRLIVRSYERLDCFAIQIVDNGPGIGPDKKFEGKQSFKSIKKRLKSSCGGSIEIKVKPDKGTIVTVKIPKEGYIIKE